MDNIQFKHGDVEVSVISTENEDGSHAVEIKAVGDKAQVEAFMKEVVNGTAHMNVPFEVSIGKEDGPSKPIKVSDLMGRN